MRVEGNIVDVIRREIFSGSVEIENGKIVAINRHEVATKSYIMLGFVDAHIHIESSMLTPQNFGHSVVKHGTVAVVTDPHEIANVMGVEGVNFMIENSKKSPIKTYFTIPSSVPATSFDVAGGSITASDVEELAASGRFVALSEMMNVPGVLHEDSEVVAKLTSAKRHNLPIDGHAPLLRGDQLKAYIDSGISTDHESVLLEEAKEKISMGMKVLIREGSAARNYDEFAPLISTNPDDIMFCSDDLHPDDIIAKGHIKNHVIRALSSGYNLFDILKIATINPINHYNLSLGELRVGDSADFIVVEDLTCFEVEAVYINGVNRLKSCYKESDRVDINNFNHDLITPLSLIKEVRDSVQVISLLSDLVTESKRYVPKLPTLNLESDIESDIIKIVYLNRYNNGEPQVAYCSGFNLKRGAFASSVAHDSHNIIAVGCSDRDIAAAINIIIENRGGLSVATEDGVDILPLPIAGLMSNDSGERVADEYIRIDSRVKEMGCSKAAPFMSLSFLSLLVIPELKIGEKGLFCYRDFNWVD